MIHNQANHAVIFGGTCLATYLYRFKKFISVIKEPKTYSNIADEHVQIWVFFGRINSYSQSVKHLFMNSM